MHAYKGKQPPAFDWFAYTAKPGELVQKGVTLQLRDGPMIVRSIKKVEIMANGNALIVGKGTPPK